VSAWLRRYLCLVRLDAKLALRHKLVHVTVIVAAVFGALIGFAVPEQLDYASVAGGAELVSAAPSELSTVTVLEPGAVKPPFDGLVLTTLYALDLCLLGFMFGSVMLLQDKEQGTIRYFRVGPGSGAHYLAAKLTVNLGLTLLNLVTLTALAAPRALAEPRLYLLALLICAGMTLLGMAIAVFLRSIAQWFFPLIAVSLLGTTPVYLMFTPTQALAWTWWLPTYHMLFGAEAILFTGERAVITAALAYGLVFAVLAGLVCGLLVHTRLLKEAH
jgi:hypothetical protein